MEDGSVVGTLQAQTNHVSFQSRDIFLVGVPSAVGEEMRKDEARGRPERFHVRTRPAAAGFTDGVRRC